MLKLLWIFLLTFDTGCGCNDYAQCIYNEVFRNYTPDVRPMKSPNETLPVKIKLYIHTLKAITETTETMETVGYFYTSWTDHRLQWDPELYGGVKKIAVPAMKVWVPDLVLYNSDNSFYDSSYRTDFLLFVAYSGHISWSYGGPLSTRCPMNVAKYPYDSQNCDIIVDSWRYDKSRVQLEFYGSGMKVNATALTNPVWQLHDYKVSRYLMYYDKYWRLNFTMMWKRRSLYYNTNIMAPICLLSLVSLGVYWLPLESGEKVSIAITVLLAFSVFQIVIMNSTPVNSEHIPNITKFVLLAMALSTLSLMSSMFVVYINCHSMARPPLWLRKLCSLFLSKIMCVPFPKKIAKNGDTSSGISNDDDIGKDVKNANTTTGKPFISELSSIRNSLNNIASHMEDTDKSEEIKHEWLCIGRIIDRILFWMHSMLQVGLVIYIFFT